MKRKIFYSKHDFLWRRVFMAVLLCCGVYVYGQNKSNPLEIESLFKNQVVNTPATGALMQNIVYPVNYSTGLPEIKIPLYEVKSGDLTLPIYLTYHASGVKLSDVSGLVGQGWRLVAEPMVSRTIKGRDDIYKGYTCPFKKRDYLDRNYCYHLAKGESDEQPDEFYYQLPGKQGMFMYVLDSIGKDMSFAPLPYENIRIKLINKKFHITDDDGTLYKFDGGEERNSPSVTTVGWKASSMLSANRKDSIVFVYGSKYNFYQIRTHNDYITVIDRFNHKSTLHTFRENDVLLPGGNMPDEWMQEPIVYQTINNKTISYQVNDSQNLVADMHGFYPAVSSPTINTLSNPLSEIKFAGGKVVFEQDAKLPRLNKIIVYNIGGSIVREINLNYKVYNTASERYFLDNISVTDRDYEPRETYSFSYHMPGNMMKPGTRFIDYWGYYNGVYRADTTTLVPLQTVESCRRKLDRVYGLIDGDAVRFNIGFGSREANEKYMKYGVLTGITYPTGSTDEFTYEAHRYKQKDGSIRIVGGLRIKAIKTLVGGEETKVRTFTYGEYEDGVGYSMGNNNLEYFSIEQTKYYGSPLKIRSTSHGDEAYVDDNDFYTARCRTYFCNPVIPITYENGSAVMYDYVTEYNGTPEVNSGKTVYEYDVVQLTLIPPMISTIQDKKYDGWKYGNLISKTVYKNCNGKYEPVEKERNIYSTSEKYFGTIQVGECIRENIVRWPESNNNPELTRAEYSTIYHSTSIDIGAKLLMNSCREVYDGGQINRTDTKYEYSDSRHIYPTRTIIQGMDTVRYITVSSYPHDYGSTLPYKDMVARNIVSPVVKKDFIHAGKHLEVETPYASPYPDIYQPSGMNVKYGANNEPESRFTYLYDEWGRIRQKTKDEKEKVTYLYGYNHQYVIAEIANVGWEEVVKKISGGASVVNQIANAVSPTDAQWKLINNLRTLLPHAQVRTYVYQPLVGVSSIMDPRGVVTCYEYDDVGRYVKSYIVNDNKNELLERVNYHYKNEFID